MLHSSKPRIGIVGTGRLGSQFSYWLARAGSAPSAIYSRDANHAANSVRLSALGTAHAADVGGVSNPTTNTLQASSLQEVLDASDVLLLAIPDAALRPITAAMAELPASLLKGKLIAHCCGALPASVLDPVKDVGAELGCFHPIQSFPSLDPNEIAEVTPSRSFFNGIAAGIEASDQSLPVLQSLAKSLGCTPLRLSGDPKQRALYHAAAVVAGNAMVGLLDFAMDLMELSGIERESGRFALLPLMGGTLSNLVTMQPGQALTGPISRGDGETVAAHLDALEIDPSLQALYSNLSARLLLLAVKSGRISGTQASEVSEVLLSRLMRGRTGSSGNAD